MIKKINDFLAGWPMTLVGGAFLLASFLLPRAGYPAGEALAWVCVVICGLPLLYLAVHRLIVNKGISKISSALLISMAMIAALMIGDGRPGPQRGILLCRPARRPALRQKIQIETDVKQQRAHRRNYERLYRQQYKRLYK